MYGKLNTIVNNNFLRVPLAFAGATAFLLEKHRLLNHRTLEYIAKMLRPACCWASRFSFACQSRHIRRKGNISWRYKADKPFFSTKNSKTKSPLPLKHTLNVFSSVCNISTMTPLNLLKYISICSFCFHKLFPICDSKLHLQSAAFICV